jgi:adenosylhomocysteine nucleosidase
MTAFPLTVVAALEDEIRDLRSRMEVAEDLRLSPGRLTAGTWDGLPLLLLRTGVGTAATERALRLLLEKFSPGFALQLGYAGGTVPELQAGDLVIATALIEAGRGHSFPVAPELLARADQVRRQAGLPGVCGPIVTVARPALTPAAKAAIGREHQVPALEMESATFAELCGAANLPFLVVRAILDPLDFSLAYLFQADGSTPRPRGQNPFQVPPLKPLADQARRSLTAFIIAWWKDFSRRET